LQDCADPSTGLPRRKKPAHFATVESGNRSTIIFLTVCTKRRRPLLATDEAVNLLIAAWIAASFWSVGRYVILPDHVHLVLRAKHVSASAAEKLDFVLEKSDHARVAEPR
jgi:hypothetical protein